MTALPGEYGPLARELLWRAVAQRQPAMGAFELTADCNLSCRMCYVRPDRAAVRPSAELSASAWGSLTREAVDEGLVFLLLTGREPFLRPDFFELYEPLTHLGLMITLFTNGTLITPAVAERLAQAPPSRTEITLYGATAATYEAVTGVPGSYARCCDGIEALVGQRVPLGLKTTITRQNVGELEAMREMAHSWGLPFMGGWLLTRRPDGNPSEVDQCRLSAGDCIALEATDQASADDWTEAALRGPTAHDGSNYYCGAGRGAFVVNPAGEMNVCLDLPQPRARPLEVGFAAAWTQVQQYVDAAPPLGAACRDCEALAFCPRCPAWSLMETGTLTEPVPYLCEIARERKEFYGQRV